MRLPIRFALLLGLLLSASARVHAQDVRHSETHAFTVGGDGTVDEDVTVTVEYVSARSVQQTEFSVHEQYFNRIRDFRAEIDGRGVSSRQFETRRAQSRDIFLSGGTIRSFTLAEAPQPGQRLVYSYRRTYPDAAYLPILYVPAVDRLERYEIVVDAPTMEVAFDVTTPQGAPYQTTGDGARIVFESLDAPPSVPLFALDGLHAAVQIDLRRGDTVLTPTAPNELAGWYNRLTAGVDTSITTALRTRAETLRRDTPRETIAAIHDHVRAIRYIADERAEGAFTPRAPDIVHDRQYGDCKDRAFLASALARALDLRVDVVLASTVATPATAGVAVGLYNHAICAYEEAGERVYFDPTHPYLPFGDLPESDLDGRALRLGAGGAEDVTLVAQDSLPALDVSIRLGLDATDRAEASVVARGQTLATVREALTRGNATDAADALSYVAGETLYRIRLSGMRIVDDTPEAVTFAGQADLSQFVVASPTRRYLPQTPFRAVPAEAPSRASDALAIDVPERINARLALHVPAGAWAAEATDVSWGGPLAGFDARLDPQGDETVVTYRFHQRTRHFAGTDRDAYLDLAGRYLGARRDVFTFRPTAGLAADAPPPAVPTPE